MCYSLCVYIFLDDVKKNFIMSCFKVRYYMEIAQEQQEENIIEILSLIHKKYAGINSRLSDAELYYIAEYFIERDKYNEKKRTQAEMADKIISYAKGECVTEEDIITTDKYIQDNKLKIEEICNEVEKEVKEDKTEEDYHQKIKKYWKKYGFEYLNEGDENYIICVSKEQIGLKTKHADHKICIALSYHRSKGKIYLKIYNGFKISNSHVLQKFLSLVERNTKYYQTESMSKINIEKKFMEEANEFSECNEEDIEEQEKYKQFSRNALFSITDRENFGYFDKNIELKKIKYGDKNRPIAFSKDRKYRYIDIDLSKLSTTCLAEEHIDIIKKTPKIQNEIKKQLLINPKILHYLIIEQCSKIPSAQQDDIYEFGKTMLEQYLDIIKQTAEYLKDIKEISTICSTQEQIYEDYLKEIKNKNIKEIREEIEYKNAEIEKKINSLNKKEIINKEIKGQAENLSL